MQIVRWSSLSATPWKNGGGVTHEMMRVPACGADFRWRLSVAQIDVSGPFSDFAGYTRTMVLLKGAGVRLTFGGADPVSLNRMGSIVEFDGALKTNCLLLDGPCTDLNLMVSRTLNRVTARVERILDKKRVPLAASPDHITLVFGISGSVRLERDIGAPVRLDAWDLAILPMGCRGTLAAAPDQGSSSLVFCATLDDNSA